jgi:hypothetical protein
MDGWIYGWMDEWMDVWTVGWILGDGAGKSDLGMMRM